MTALSYQTLPNPNKSIQATPPVPTLALNQTTPCTTQAKPKPPPPLPAVTLSVVTALKTLWTRLPAMQWLAPRSVRPLRPRQLHQAQPATIAEYQLETLGVIIELSQSLVKWKDDTQKWARCHALTMGVRYIRMKNRVQAICQRTLRSGSRVRRGREKSRVGFQHRIQPLKKARPHSPISHTSQKASRLFVSMIPF